MAATGSAAVSLIGERCASCLTQLRDCGVHTLSGAAHGADDTGYGTVNRDGGRRGPQKDVMYR